MSGHDPRRRDYSEDATRQHPRYRRDDPPPERYDDPYYEPEGEYYRERQRLVYSKIANVVWLFTFIILSIIGLRVILRMINANEANEFVSWVYDVSWFFVRPFSGIVEDPTMNGSVLEINSLIAMLIYTLLIYGILQLVRVILDLTTPPEP